MSFPKYANYRDSRVPWLGDLPSNWTVSRLRFEAWVRARLGWKGLKAEEYVDDGFPMLATPNIKSKDIDFQGAHKIDAFRFEESPEIKLRVGDVLLAKDGSTLGTVNVVRSLPRPTTVNSSIAVITPGPTLDSLFLGYLFQSSFMENIIASLKGGMGVPHLFQEDINKFYLPLPPIEHQQEIGRFLDRETTKIDALVDEQTRLIELLKEKRQAVISQALTKGLDTSVPMKDSGVEWLGEVPAHWEVRRVNSISTKITNGYVGPTRDILVDEGIRYLQSLHIKANRIKFDVPYFVSSEWSMQHSKSILETGDVLIVQTGDIGQAAVVPDEFAGCNCHALIIVSPLRTVVSGEYLGWVFNSDYGKHSLLAIQTGALHPHLNCGNVKDVFMPLPPKHEQQRIVEHCVVATRRFDELMFEAEAAVELLQERRSALISAAVTGKIDVRGLVPQRESAAA